MGISKKKLGVVIGIPSISSAILIVLLLSMTFTYYAPLNMGIDVDKYSVHLTVWHNGKLVSHHAGNLTDYGEIWFRAKAFRSNATIGAQNMTFWGNTNSTTAYSETWTSLPDEITTGNMTDGANRYQSEGASIEFIGNNQANITFVFNPTETNTTRRAGLYSQATGNYLICTDVISPIINYGAGDTITLEFSITVDEA